MAQIIDVPGQGPVEFPDDMTDEQIAAVLRTQPPPAPRDQWLAKINEKPERIDPTEGMSGAQRFFAGVGKGMTDVARGVGQAVGLVSREDIAESRKLDEALMNTGAGTAGNIVGALASYLPTALIPGANTLAGASAIGAASGLLAPSASTGETAMNTVAGGLLAPAALVAARAVPAVWQGGKALVEPFTQAGQERIAARTLTEFAGGREAAERAAQAIRQARPEVPGVQNTAAEVANNAGIAQLERALRQNPQLTQQFADRLSSNRAALLEGLQGIAGDDAALARAVSARDDAASALYGQAFADDAARRAAAIAESQQRALAKTAGIGLPQGMAVAEKQVGLDLATPGLRELSQRPAFKAAVSRARKLAADHGRNINDPLESLVGLHYVKLAIDDMLDASSKPGSALGRNQRAALADMKSELTGELEKISEKYGAARAKYAELSRPINQMEVGRTLLDKFQPALADFGADTRTTAALYAKALRDADATAARATGYRNARMTDVLDPNQLRTAEGVAKELAKRAKADELGRIPGSNTAQNLVSQNMLRQTLGPLGLPESFAESTVLNTIMRGPQFVARLGEQRVLDRLARGLLSPQDAATLLTLEAPTSVPMRGLLSVQPYIPAAALGSMYGGQ